DYGATVFVCTYVCVCVCVCVDERMCVVLAQLFHYTFHCKVRKICLRRESLKSRNCMAVNTHQSAPTHSHTHILSSTHTHTHTHTHIRTHTDRSTKMCGL